MKICKVHNRLFQDKIKRYILHILAGQMPLYAYTQQPQKYNELGHFFLLDKEECRADDIETYLNTY